jgi:hypothetical protein
MENNIFEKASRLRTRFATGKGFASVEDLWDLSVESLDKIAININEELEKSSGKGLLAKKTSNTKELELKLDIVTHVFNVKQAEAGAAKDRAVKRERLAFLKNLAAEKQIEALKGSSLDEIQKEIDALESEI